MYKDLSKKKRAIQQNQFVTFINLSLESTKTSGYMIRDVKPVQSTHHYSRNGRLLKRIIEVVL